ncbi:hypothetical protein [Pseudofulvimonas gallinarii]
MAASGTKKGANVGHTTHSRLLACVTARLRDCRLRDGSPGRLFAY